MDLDDLRCFLAGVDAPTFRVAARRVALSPGAFSDRIRRLEDHLGTPLFERTTRNVSITEAGLRLRPHALHVVSAAEQCGAVARGDQGTPPYELTIGTRFELGLSWLTPALDALEATAPERTVHLFMGDSPDLLGRVERGEIDAVVFSARITSPRVRYGVLHPEAYRFVGAPGTPVMTQPDDATGLTLLDVTPDLPLFRYVQDAADRGAVWPFARYQYLGGIGAIRALALAGAGIAVLPEYFVQDDLDAGRLVDIAPHLDIPEDVFRLVWRRDHPLTERLVVLAEQLAEIPLR